MKRKIVLLFLACIITIAKLFAQGQFNNWYWGFSRLTFNTSPPSLPTPPSLQFSQAVMSSSTGVLLFYTDGNFIKDASHNSMPNGNINPLSTIYGSLRVQAVLIVPDPSNTNRYYVFTVKDKTTNSTRSGELRYSIVDMSLNGGMGDVLSTAKEILVDSNLTYSITAVKQTGTNNFWILAHHKLIGTPPILNNFYAYLLSGSGISNIPVVSTIGPLSYNDSPYSWNTSFLKSNPQGTKVVFDQSGYHLNTLDSTELYDFNANTGVLSNCQILTSGINYSIPQSQPHSYGVEFSADGNLLYKKHNKLVSLVTVPDTILQFNLNANNAISFINNYSTTTTRSYFFQLAPDGKIYITQDSNYGGANTIPTISVIDQPNVIGLGCKVKFLTQNASSVYISAQFPNIVPSIMGFRPMIDTQYANNISFTTATLNANVSWSGNAPITQRGFYYSTSPLPVTNPTIVTGTTGNMSANISGLIPNMLYYYRAYATNANGTTYYYDSTFHTLAPNAPPVIKNVHNKTTCVSDTMCFIVVDAETKPTNVSLTFTSSNTNLISLSNISISGTDTNKILSFTPTPYQSGTSLITITATDSNGLSSVQIFSVSVAAGIPVSISAPNGTITCGGDSLLFTCSIPQGTTINWYVNALASGIGTAQYATTQSASIYAVCTNAQGCATKSNTINATVKPTPQVQCTINGPATICVGDSVQLQALSTAGYSYQWFKNTQLLPNANSAIYYAKQSGDYSYVATLNGCSKTSNAQSVQVVPAPIASITTPSTTVICNGQGALLQATTGTGYTYQWTMNGFDIAGATNPTYTATIGSYYTVKVSNGYCARTSSPITITVNTAPVAIIHWNGTQLFSPISFYSYQWYLNGVLIPGATGQYYTPTQTGLYYVMVSNENGCKSLSPNFNLLTLSINSLSIPSLPIYPNPTSGMLQVDNFKEGTLYVYNAMGQLIIQQTDPIIDLSKQANGIYHIRAYNQAQELIGIGRVVKE